MGGLARALCGAIVILLTTLLLYAFATGDVIGDQFHVWERIWGLYVWADVYAGFVLFALIVHAVERRAGVTIALFLLACCTGNMVYAAWLLWRGPALFRRLSESLAR